MALFSRKQSVETGTEDDKYYDFPWEKRRWPVVLVYLFVALLVAVGVVFAARWAYRESTNNEQQASLTSSEEAAKEESSSKEAAEAERKNAESSEDGEEADGSAAGDGSEAASSEDGQNSDSGAAQGDSSEESVLPDSGPGGVVAIFVASSLAAAGLHYIVSVRRNN